MNKFRRIRTQKEYGTALARFEIIFHAKAGTKEGMEADKLALQIAEYEQAHFKVVQENKVSPLQK